MCGIVGFYHPEGLARTFGEECVHQLSATLVHRGPDDAGAWADREAGIALGHRRLSVLDLSRAGHQPMLSKSGTYMMAFNGEIYNHLAIRSELEEIGSPQVWTGHSDTETLLAAIDQWGIEAALRKSIGMYAFALWNRKERTLTLARDRIGEKPLYYGWQGKFFLFGSELKALRAHAAFHAGIDRDALAMYLRSGFIAAPHSIYKGIFKLLPGTYLQLAASNRPRPSLDLQKYWSIEDTVANGASQRFSGTDSDAIDQLEEKLKEAIALQSIADVPLGAFLSGGIDSTTVVALMQAQSVRPVKTFTIGFHETAYNEAQHARSVAKHLGTDHTELYVSPREAMNVVPKLPELYDEPLGDSSSIPSFLVAQLARKDVTVSLSGDGGDELFGGYSRYLRTYSIWQALSRVPFFARKGLASTLRGFSQHEPPSSIAWKANRLANYLSARGIEEFYKVQMAQRHGELALVLGSSPKSSFAAAHGHPINLREHPYDSMMRMDLQTYLPDDILFKIDRACMGVSLETRVPMLDHRIVEFAWRLPLRLKVRGHQGKWLLKQLLGRYVPQSSVDRPKMGFGIPIGDWVRGPLRDWAEELVAENRLRQEGYLNPGLVREQWSRHVNEDRGGGDSIWTILMFQAWLASLA